MPKACKHHGDQDYAIILRYGCKNSVNRFQEHSDSVNDLQCVRGLENTYFWLLWVVENARKRLVSIASFENVSNGDFELTLFFDFFRFCLLYSACLQPSFWSASPPYVSHNALGLFIQSKSSSFNDFGFDLIPFEDLSKYGLFSIFLCTLGLGTNWKDDSCIIKLETTQNPWLLMFWFFIWFILI